jgi:hypothetical protein
MNATIKASLEAIRASGLSNMLDFNSVQRIANDREFYELVVWMEDHKKDYIHFILTGIEPEEDI